LSTTKADIERLFSTYRRAWNARDFEGVIECYSKPSLMVTKDRTIVLQDSTTMRAVLDAYFKMLDAAGFDHSDLGELAIRECGDDLAVVDVARITRYRKDGSVLESVSGHYVVKFENSGWRFVVVTMFKSQD
jgi:ketosteroid isomerase-like protein